MKIFASYSFLFDFDHLFIEGCLIVHLELGYLVVCQTDLKAVLLGEYPIDVFLLFLMPVR